MGKNKRGKLGGASNKKQKPCLKPKALAAIKTRVSQSGAITKPGSKAAPTKQHKQLLHSEPTIPFAKNDRILLIGDGDLSFARSLVEHHGIKKLTATVLEKDVTELEGKYSHVVDNLAVLEGNDEGVKLVYNVDATKMGVWDAQGNVGKKKGRRGGIDRILFNFPHVGGKSKDVNRQVRYNQELVVNFFKAAIPSLASHGSIIVTLFEGMPYTLWNIRDLARHSGLAVERSFRFQASAYPGYKHARTLGVVRDKHGEESEMGWKGEERPSRSFVFVRKMDMETKKGTKNEVVDGKPPKVGKMRGERDSEGSDEEMSDDDVGSWSDDDVEGMDDEQEPEDEVSS